MAVLAFCQSVHVKAGKGSRAAQAPSLQSLEFVHRLVEMAGEVSLIAGYLLIIDKDQALRQAQKTRKRLRESANTLKPFPERPKGMHHDTYMRLYWEHHEVETEQLIGMREWLDKLQKQIG